MKIQNMKPNPQIRHDGNRKLYLLLYFKVNAFPLVSNTIFGKNEVLNKNKQNTRNEQWHINHTFNC